MELIKKMWRFRALIFLVAAGILIWYGSNENEKDRIELERKIKAYEGEKKIREESLFTEYRKKKSKEKCGISFAVTLETFGEDVNVELRSGEPGNSFPLVIKRANSGKLNYDGLCEGKYFIAIGNDTDVSTTPVQLFVNGKTYTSTVQLTKGVGNMSSKNRNQL